MNFRIGQTVACIRDLTPIIKARGRGEVCPQRGMVYTVRCVRYFPEFDMIGILLEEVVNVPDISWGGETLELHFREKEFRPVKETSIEVFTSMLNRMDA